MRDTTPFKHGEAVGVVNMCRDLLQLEEQIKTFHRQMKEENQ